MPPIVLPREKRFLRPSPQRVEAVHLAELREKKHINTVTALQMQCGIHELMTDPEYYVSLKRWPRTHIRRIQAMAYDGLYPLPEDFELLKESLRGKSGPIHERVKTFREEMERLIVDEEMYWMNTRWYDDPLALREHQDTEAGRLMTKKLAGRVAFFGSARLDE